MSWGLVRVLWPRHPLPLTQVGIAAGSTAHSYAWSNASVTVWSTPLWQASPLTAAARRAQSATETMRDSQHPPLDFGSAAPADAPLPFDLASAAKLVAARFAADAPLPAREPEDGEGASHRGLQVDPNGATAYVGQAFNSFPNGPGPNIAAIAPPPTYQKLITAVPSHDACPQSIYVQIPPLPTNPLVATLPRTSVTHNFRVAILGSARDVAQFSVFFTGSAFSTMFGSGEQLTKNLMRSAPCGVLLF